MLRVVEEAARSDAGRQRLANEDAYFARSPAYAVADGMGGAQAGEVAARIAAESFENQLSESGSAEEKLARAANEANRRIFEMARSDASVSGMGTTLTGALVSDNEVSIVHVGDSRAYLFRDGELRQLTRDHSLVEELRRRGRLTSEEAEEHPQRSIITRALGPDAEVEADLHSHQVRSGDVFLICSDGLTSMVREERLREILVQSPSLKAAVDSLIDEANRQGGRDNITVVMFRVSSDTDESEKAETARQETQDTRTGIDATPVRAAAARRKPRTKPVRATFGRLRRTRRVPRRGVRRRRLRRGLIGVVALVLVSAAASGAFVGLRNVYFIGQDDRGLVTLYRGVPYDLPFGIKLYDSQYVSSVQTRRLRPFERRRLLDHELRGHADAASLIRRMEQGR
jgi:serine/threonine protein phosphatase PrpC